METVILVYQTDNWGGQPCLIGVAQNIEHRDNIIQSFCDQEEIELNDEHWEMINEHGQTQCSEEFEGEFHTEEVELNTVI